MRINKNYSTVDLTNEYFKIYTKKEDTTILYFSNTAIKLDNKSFEELKDQIMLSEELSESLKMFQRACDKPSKGTILKELTKTIDRITDLTNRYDSTYYTLMETKKYHDFKSDLEVKKEILPIWQERNDLMNYKEKLEAQLKYGELQ